MTATIAMDPRIRARREEVEAEHGRQRSIRLIVVAVLLALVVGAAASTRTPLLDVDEIAITGAEHTEVDDVRAISGIVAGDPLTDLDLASARSAIATLPWVDSVTSLRRWNGTVEFEIIERTPVAQTVSADGTVVTLVDATGRVLERGDRVRSDLVAVVGAQGSVVPGGWLATSALDAVAVAAEIPPALTTVINEVDVDPSGSISLVVEAVGQVRLGSSIDLNLKLISLETLMAQADLSCVAELDLQVPTVPVLTRISGC